MRFQSCPCNSDGAGLSIFQRRIKKKISLSHTVQNNTSRLSFKENDGDLADYCFSLTLVRWKRLLIIQQQLRHGTFPGD